MNTLKKVIALGVVATMLIGSTVTSFASETPQSLTNDTAGGSATGSGVNEGGVATHDVFKVEVPTVAAIQARLWYTIDQDGWIKETKAARYAEDLAGGNIPIDDSYNVLFKNWNAAGKISGMSNVSSPISITNKGTKPVALEVKAEWAAAYASGTEVKRGATKIDFSGAGEANELYMAMYTNSKDETPLAQASVGNDAIAITSAGKSSADLYKAEWDATGNTYTYTLPEASESKAAKVDVYFKGSYKDGAATTYDDNGTEKALSVPGIKITFKATNATDNIGVAYWDRTTLWFAAVNNDDDGGLKVASAPTAFEIDGKNVLSSLPSGFKTDATGGWAQLTWEQVYKAYGYTAEPTDGWEPQVIKFTVDSKTYIADIR